MSPKNKNKQSKKSEVKQTLDQLDGRPVIDPIVSKATAGKRQISGSLRAKDTAKLNKICNQPPNGYYIIVGQGAAAVVNHTTLRQSKEGCKRLEGPRGTLPVLHLGFDDPWRHYHNHGMGQPPFLLRLPGYHHPVSADAATIRSGLSSRTFAASTLKELELLEKEFESYRAEGWVAAIQTRDQAVPDVVIDRLVDRGLNRTALEKHLKREYPKSYPPYRLVVVTRLQSLKFAYAYKVDFCCGAGTMNLTPRDEAAIPPAYQEADRKPWQPPWVRDHGHRKVVHGADGLTAETEWDSRHRYCISGSGGIALNQIERSHDVAGHCLDWYAPRSLAGTFNLERNDTVLQGPDGEPMEPGGLGPRPVPWGPYIPIPAVDRWRFGQNCPITPPAVEGGALRIQLNAPEATTRIKDQFAPDEGANANLGFNMSVGYRGVFTRHADETLYDRLILSMGQLQNVVGEPRSVADPFDFDGIIEPLESREVGLVDDDSGDLRVLGAAATMFPDIDNDPQTPRWRTEQVYRPSLPISTVPPGFILSAVNIAYANQYFDKEFINFNVNTMSGRELMDSLMDIDNLFQPGDLPAKKTDKQKCSELRKAIIRARRAPHNGCKDEAELAGRLNQDALFPVPSLRINQLLQTIEFEYDYGNPRGWVLEQ